MRDLQRDLELCNAATPGPWEVEGAGGVHMDGTRDAYFVVRPSGQYRFAKLMREDGQCCARFVKLQDAQLFIEAREGWPEAIQRAMATEAERDALRAQLSKAEERAKKLQEQVHGLEAAEAKVKRLESAIREILDTLREHDHKDQWQKILSLPDAECWLRPWE